MKENLGQLRLSGTAWTSTSGGWWAFAFSCFFLLLYGILSLFFISFSRDYFNGLVIAYTILFVVQAFLILTNFSGLVAAPEDFDRLAFRPISSSLYFYVKVSLISFFSFIWALCFSFPVTLWYLFTSYPQVSAGFLLGIFLQTFFIISLSMLGYITVVKRFGKQKFQTVLDIFQFLFTLALLGIAYLQQNLFRISTIGTPILLQGLRDRWWVFLLPSSWFASLTAFFVNDPMVHLRIVGLAGGLLTFSLLIYILTRLPGGYLMALSEVLKETGAGPPRKLFLPFQRNLNQIPWERWIKNRTQRTLTRFFFTTIFREPKSRMTLLTLVVVSFLFILFLSFGVKLPEEINPADRYLFSVTRTLERTMYFISIFYVMAVAHFLNLHLQHSRYYPASWIYYVVPHKASSILACYWRILFSLVASLFLLLFGVFFLRFAFSWLMVQELIVVFWILILSTQLTYLLYPRFLFSASESEERKPSHKLLMTLAVPAVAFSVTFALILSLSKGLPVFGLELILLTGIGWVLWRKMEPGVEKRLEDVEV